MNVFRKILLSVEKKPKTNLKSLEGSKVGDLILERKCLC